MATILLPLAGYCTVAGLVAAAALASEEHQHMRAELVLWPFVVPYMLLLVIVHRLLVRGRPMPVARLLRKVR